jgi:hypothetical protein
MFIVPEPQPTRAVDVNSSWVTWINIEFVHIANSDRFQAFLAVKSFWAGLTVWENETKHPAKFALRSCLAGTNKLNS